AERDYFTLRSRIELAAKQIAGLQQYIREQCLKRSSQGALKHCAR
ncbi:lysis system i-spanin subunit Rz, partial [Pantoea piersonii]